MRDTHDCVNDLNLLAALDLLLDTRSVTAAAARAGITQSAMSRTLARLRDAFGDPLFVRTRKGMEPTTAALALAEPTRAALASARAVFAARHPRPFDPAAERRDVRIAATDFGALVTIPPLVAQLRREAPGITITSVPLPPSPTAALEAGELDLAIVFGAPPRAGLRWQVLFEDELVCVGRKNHPALAKRLTLARYLDHAHLSITPAGIDAIDRMLARDRRERSVAARTSHFLLAPSLLRDSDLLLTTGRRVAEQLARIAPALQIAPSPVDVGPLRIGQLWHERADSEPAHAWLRAAIRTHAQTANAHPAR